MFGLPLAAIWLVIRGTILKPILELAKTVPWQVWAIAGGLVVIWLWGNHRENKGYKTGYGVAFQECKAEREALVLRQSKALTEITNSLNNKLTTLETLRVDATQRQADALSLLEQANKRADEAESKLRLEAEKKNPSLRDCPRAPIRRVPESAIKRLWGR